MDIVIFNETIWQALQVNAQGILSKLKEWAWSQCLFILYDNINFYETVRDQRLYNKAHVVNYTAEYIRYMPVSDESHLPYINGDPV